MISTEVMISAKPVSANMPPRDPFALRQLGRTSLEVTTLGVGSAQLGELYHRMPNAQATGMVAAAKNSGVNLFDTAPLYGAGLAEHRVGEALRDVTRNDIIVSTKVGRWYESPSTANPYTRSDWAGGLPFNARLDYSYDGAMRSLEQSKMRLGMNRIDIALIHDVDVFTHGSREACDRRFDQAMNGAYRALAELRRCGDIKAVGVGVNEADMCARFARAGDFDCMLLAGRYSLLEQGALDEFLPLAEKKGIGVLIGGVFNSGILARGSQPGGKYDYRDASPEILERVARIEVTCESFNVPLAAAALQFPLGHGSVSSVVVGAVSAQEIRQNIEWMRTAIPPALWEALREQSLLNKLAPTPGNSSLDPS